MSKMNTRLSTRNYDFYVDGTKLLVLYKDTKDTKDIIVLSDLQIDILGVTSTNNEYVVTLVTSASIQKLKHDVSDTLEVAGFTFDSMKSALAALNFIALWLEELKEDE